MLFRSLASRAQQVPHPAGDDQRARRGIQLFSSFQDSHTAARASQEVSSEKPGSRSANDSNFLLGVIHAAVYICSLQVGHLVPLVLLFGTSPLGGKEMPQAKKLHAT